MHEVGIGDEGDVGPFLRVGEPFRVSEPGQCLHVVVPGKVASDRKAGSSLPAGHQDLLIFDRHARRLTRGFGSDSAVDALSIIEKMRSGPVEMKPNDPFAVMPARRLLSATPGPSKSSCSPLVQA